MAKKERNKEEYLEGIGRRKTAKARVRIFPYDKQKKILVNKKELKEYFPLASFVEKVKAPLEAVGQNGKFYISAKVYGGGQRGQSEAIQLGMARALVKLDEEFQKTLRDLDYLKRDPRRKERKKPGLKKARRAPQWSKR